jgi:hypothetical protein
MRRHPPEGAPAGAGVDHRAGGGGVPPDVPPGDHRARGLCRVRRQWAEARQHLGTALDVYREIGDRPAEARALHECGLLLRDQGDVDDAGQAFDASQAIFAALGDAIWTARVLVGKAPPGPRSRRHPGARRRSGTWPRASLRLP